MKISTRHEGDLDRQLIPFSESGRTAVTLILDEAATSMAVQHTAWMLANLLVRLDGYVDTVSVCCPRNVAVHENVFPLRVQATDFGSALISAARSLELVPVVEGLKIGISLHIGPGPAPQVGWRVYGSGWCGGVTKRQIAGQPTSSLPFGPYVAACLAAAEIFKEMRMHPEHYLPTEGFYDTWSLMPASGLESNGPAELMEAKLECTLAGVGAVGNAFLHSMSACPALHFSATVADNDSKGIDLTNLNRYVLFGKSAIGMLKPDAVFELFQHTHLHLQPWNGAVEALPKIANRVLSAVDKNRAREGIQFHYPARIISASTSDLRAEVHRCGPPGNGACLRCYNPPEVLPSDEDLVNRLRTASTQDFLQLCEKAGVSVEDGKAWVNTRKCGQAGERLLSVLRDRDDDQGAFAVGFTSVLAGTLLATEFIKDCTGALIPTNGSQNRAVFQFFDAMSSVNYPSFLSNDPKCPACNSQRPGLAVWKRRFVSLGTNR